MANTGKTYPTADTGSWTNGSYAYEPGMIEDYATETTLSQYHDWWNFEDASNVDLTTLIPSTATIDGIEVEINGYAMGAEPFVNGDYGRIACYLWNAGSASYTSRKTVDYDPATMGSPEIRTFGGATDKWGKSWVVGDFSNANWDLELSYYAKSAATTGVAVDYIAVTVYYTEASGTSHLLTMLGVGK
jgi:hypothetical protein